MEESFIRRGDVAIDVQKVTSDSEKSLTSPISVYGNYNQLEYTTVEYDDFINISEYTIQYEYEANGNMIEKTSFDEEQFGDGAVSVTFII